MAKWRSHFTSSWVALEDRQGSWRPLHLASTFRASAAELFLVLPTAWVLTELLEQQLQCPSLSLEVVLLPCSLNRFQEWGGKMARYIPGLTCPLGFHHFSSPEVSGPRGKQMVLSGRESGWDTDIPSSRRKLQLQEEKKEDWAIVGDIALEQTDKGLYKILDSKWVDPVVRTRKDSLGNMSTYPRGDTARLSQAELRKVRVRCSGGNRYRTWAQRLVQIKNTARTCSISGAT